MRWPSLLDGAVLGSRSSPPYELGMAISDQLAGRELKFSSLVTDSAGQQVLSPESVVTVVARVEPRRPNFTVEAPIDNQRFVEGTPYLHKLTSSLGILPDVKRDSGIEYVEFFLDGAKVGETYYPMYETRKVEGSQEDEEEMFEVWQIEQPIAEISVQETSVAALARVHTQQGGVFEAPGVLIRVIENTNPIARILKPVQGQALTVGEDMEVTISVTDDTLALGTFVALRVNGQELVSETYKDRDERFTGAFDVQDPLLRLHVAHRPRVPRRDPHPRSARGRLPPAGDPEPRVAAAGQRGPGPHRRDRPPGGGGELRGRPADRAARQRVRRPRCLAGWTSSSTTTSSGPTARPPTRSFGRPRRRSRASRRLPSTRTRPTARARRRAATRSRPPSGRTKSRPSSTSRRPPSTSPMPVTTYLSSSKTVTSSSRSRATDNVGVVRLELQGLVKPPGEAYQLTGQPTDIITDEEFPPQQIPGVLNAYSALKLVAAPTFKDLEGVAIDRYPIRATAYDEVGNSSTLEVVVGITNDRPPEIQNVFTDKNNYFAVDSPQLDIVAKDDRGVVAIESRFYLGSEVTPFTSIRHDASTGLVPMDIVQDRMIVALADHGITNERQDIRVEVVATDNRGQQSDPYEVTLPVIPDETGPLAGIGSPIQGTTVFAGDTIRVEWRAVDETRLDRVRVTVGGTDIYDSGAGLGVAARDGNFNWLVPPVQGDGDVTLVLIATDIYGNSSTTNWHYTIADDEPPTVTLRSPAPGSRLVEGEAFVVNASVSDNREVVSTVFFNPVERGHALRADLYRKADRPDPGGRALSVGIHARSHAPRRAWRPDRDRRARGRQRGAHHRGASRSGHPRRSRAPQCGDVRARRRLRDPPGRQLRGRGRSRRQLLHRTHPGRLYGQRRGRDGDAVGVVQPQRPPRADHGPEPGDVRVGDRCRAASTWTIAVGFASRTSSWTGRARSSASGSGPRTGASTLASVPRS